MAVEEVVPAELVEVLQKAKVLDELYENPKTRKEFLKVLKVNKPDLRIPELDTPGEVMNTLQPHLDEIAKAKKELADERAALKLERAKENLMRKHNLTEEELAEVGKTMKEKGIANVDTAIEHRRLADQVASPRSPGRQPQGFQIPNPEGLWNNTNEWARTEAYKEWDAIQNGKR